MANPDSRFPYDWRVWAVAIVGSTLIYTTATRPPASRQDAPTPPLTHAEQRAQKVKQAAYLKKQYSGDDAIPPKSMMIDWVFAGPYERTATAAQFAAPLYPNQGRDKNGHPTEELRWFTRLLTACISETADGETVNHVRISQMAAYCIAAIGAPHLIQPQRQPQG